MFFKFIFLYFLAEYAEDYFVECFQHPTDFKLVLIGDLGDFAQTRAKIAKYLAVLAPVPVLDRLPVPEPQESADAGAGGAAGDSAAAGGAADKATAAAAADTNKAAVAVDVVQQEDDRSRKNTMANKMRAPVTPPEDLPKPLSPNPPADKLPRVMRIGVRRNQLEYRVVSALKRFSWQVPFPQDIVDDVIYGGVDMRRCD